MKGKANKMTDYVYSKEEIASNVKQILKKYHAQNAILFGSYARGEAEPRSDIDLLIIGGDMFEPMDIFCIADDLYRTLDKNVDVYELREINHKTKFYDTIISEGVQIE